MQPFSFLCFGLVLVVWTAPRVCSFRALRAVNGRLLTARVAHCKRPINYYRCPALFLDDDSWRNNPCVHHHHRHRHGAGASAGAAVCRQGRISLDPLYSKASISEVESADERLNGFDAAQVNDQISIGSGERSVIVASGAAIVLALVGIAGLAGNGGWRYFLSGGICASFSHAIATPIDVIKTRQQVDEGDFVSSTGTNSGDVQERQLQQQQQQQQHAKGVFTTISELLKKEGPGILLAGLGPTVVGYFFEGAFKFGIYELLKAPVQEVLASKFLAFIVAGTGAGVIASFVLCPMEALRIRLVSEPHFTEKGWIDGGLSIIENEGVQGLSKGITAMLSKQVPYTVVKQVSFDFFTSLFYSFSAVSVMLAGPASDNVKFGISITSAFIAAVLSCLASQPGDMLLSVVNAHQGKKKVSDFVKDIVSADGVAGFFVGIKARMAHIVLIVTTQLVIYDAVKMLMGIALTGST